ncbi:hypothetical protein GGR57DRAFT_497564 [Xylariaceae sp. FL1272]|nr:hypothetical protein GGR57DRAFT_497564 [Xylariaceae sp. FL1272]
MYASNNFTDTTQGVTYIPLDSVNHNEAAQQYQPQSRPAKLDAEGEAQLVYPTDPSYQTYPYMNQDHNVYSSGQYEPVDQGAAPPYPAPVLEDKEMHPHFSILDWWWEITALLACIGGTVAMIVILAIENDKSLSHWHFVVCIDFLFTTSLSFCIVIISRISRAIAPNSLISIFSTITKSALMVTVASCLSQLKWVYFDDTIQPLRHFELFEEASRGPWGSAVFSLVVHFRAKLALFGSIVTIVALAFEPFTQQIIAFPTRSIPSEQVADFGVTTAYDSGLGLLKTLTVFSLPIDLKMQGAIMNGLYDNQAPVKVQCPTGNCTWEPFTTMALSAQCTNVTEDTQTTCNLVQASEQCEYMTPAGFNISASSGAGQGGATYTLFNSSAVSKWNRTLDWANSTLVEFATVNITSHETSTGGTSADFKNPHVLECSMEWKARTFHGISVVNGTFLAGETDDYDLAGVQVDPTSGSAEAGDDFWWPQNYYYTVANATTNDFKEMKFVINPNDHGIIAGHLQQVFNSDSSNDYGMALMQSSDLIQTIQNITTSVTYALGQGANATTISGTAYTSETYIRVQWRWISLPLLVIFASMLFFILTLVHSKNRNVATWKASSLLPLFTQFAGWHSSDLVVNSPRQMDTRVGQMAARFHVDEYGPRLTAAT